MSTKRFLYYDVYQCRPDAPATATPGPITPSGVELKGITGYATRDGVLYLFHVPDQLR